MEKKYSKRLFLHRVITLLLIFIIFVCGVFLFSCEQEKTETAETKKITVYLDPSGGEIDGDLGEIVFSLDEIPKLPVARREGYYFSGWDKDISDASDGDVLVATWDRRYHTVVFDSCGGEFSSPEYEVQEVGYGDMPKVPQVNRENYTFTGWDRELSPVTDNVKYTARWKLIPLSEEEVYSIALSATVELRTYDKTDIELSFGSGFFISEDGEIATAAHVIEGASRIKVRLSDGRELFVKEVVSCDFDKDIAIIKVTAKNLPAPLEISRDTADVGDTVYAIGSPGGRRGEMTSGEITRFSMVYDRSGLIVFSAHIEGGSSGGPLLDARGRAVGINVAVSAFVEEYLAVRIAELGDLIPQNMTMEQYMTEYGSEGMAKAESEPNDNENIAQKVSSGNLIRGTLSDDSDRDLYLYKNISSVTFVVAVKSEDSVMLIAEGSSSDKNAKINVRMSYGSSGDYAHVYVSVTSSSPADAYLTVKANGCKDIPILYSVHAVKK